MDKFTIACVQMKMRMHASLDDYRDDLRRYLRAANTKRARLVLFPEMAGLMLAPLLLGDARTNLLRRAEVGRKRNARAWEKVSGKAAGWLAQALKADLGAATAGLLDVEPQRLWDTYVEIFGGLARTQGVTIVAPSAWLPDPAGAPDEGRVLRNLSAIFGPSGEVLGTQAKVLGAGEDEARVAKGVGWRVIPTEVGRVGLLLGSDVLYPEVGRVLAYQNAEMLLLQGACASAASYHKLRAGTLARMQDNQLYAAASFVVGANPLRKGAEPYMGRSAILAPQELTPKYNGVLVEMGSTQSEGVVTAEWDYVALRQLWDSSETPLRRALTPEDAAPLLAALYTQLKALPESPAVELLPEPMVLPTNEITLSDESIDDEPVGELDDLPLLASVRSHWPPQVAESENGVAGEIDEALVTVDVTTNVEWTSPRNYVEAETASAIRRDDETDEMDAVEHRPEPEAEAVKEVEQAEGEPEPGPEPKAAVEAPESAQQNAAEPDAEEESQPELAAETQTEAPVQNDATANGDDEVADRPPRESPSVQGPSPEDVVN